MKNKEQIQPPFLKLVAADIVQRFGRDLGNIAIVFNNQRPVHYLKKHLAELQGQAFWSPQFFTIQEFVRQSTNRKELNRTAQIFLLNKLYTALQREQNPAFEDSLDQFFPIGEIILDDFSQLDYELVDVGMIFREMEEIALLDRQFDFLTEEQQQFLMRFWSAFSKDRHSELQARFLQLWKLLPRLYQSFRAALQEGQLHTMAGIYRDLAAGNPDSRDLVADYQQVLFVGFNALNAAESKLFRRWQEQGKALFYFDADQYYFEDPLMEAGHFIRQNLGNHGLINALGEFPSNIPARVSKQQPGLAAPSNSQLIEIIPAPGRTAQTKVLAHLLEKSPHSKGSTAIILADESLLIPILQSIPESLTDQLNITMGYPFRETLTYNILDLVLSAQQFFTTGASQNGALLSHNLLVEFMGHPYVALPAKTRMALLSELTERKSANLSLQWISSKLPGLIDQFPAFFRKVSNVGSLMDQLQLLLQSLAEKPAPSRLHNLIERTLLEQALQAIRQLQQGFEEHPDLSITLAIKLIRRHMVRVTAPLSGDPFSPIQIMGLLESRNLNFDHIFLVGANEGNLPVLSAGSTFIPYNLRRAYRLPVIENQQALSAYLFYRLLHHFEQLHLVYNAAVDYENSGEVSRFAQQICYESNLPVRTHSVALSASPSHKKEVPASPPAISIPKTGVVWQRLQAFLQESPDGERRSLSASAFALYVNSPLEFFIKYIAGIKEPPVLNTEIETNRVGNVIHNAMQLLYQPFLLQGEALNSDSFSQLLKQVPEICEQAIAEEFKGTEGDQDQRQFSGQERIVQRISEEYCRIFLGFDRNLGGAIELLELENDTEQYRLEFPVMVQGEQKSVLLKGIIDRVDRVNGEMRIVDYKTGSDSLEVRAVGLNDEGKFDFEIFNSNWKDSNKAFLQTLFYTYIYEQISGQSVTPHLYSIRKMRTEGTNFKFKIPRKGQYPITGQALEQAKKKFGEFLKDKLEELFNPDIPFVHPTGATVYEGSVYESYLSHSLDFGEEEAG